MIPVSDAQVLGNYRIGEEVVVCLDRVDVFDVGRGVVVPPTYKPRWTIGTITGVVEREGRRAYVVRFRVCQSACVSTIGEDDIQGTA